jgi:hypothetical protein
VKLSSLAILESPIVLDGEEVQLHSMYQRQPGEVLNSGRCWRVVYCSQILSLITFPSHAMALSSLGG